jgi:hypothetical protein
MIFFVLVLICLWFALCGAFAFKVAGYMIGAAAWLIIILSIILGFAVAFG